MNRIIRMWEKKHRGIVRFDRWEEDLNVSPKNEESCRKHEVME